MAKLYRVSLSDAERLLLQETITKGRASARTIARARILLKADTGVERTEWSDTTIAEAVEVSRPTVERIRKRAVTEGVEAALHDRPRWGHRTGKLTGEQEARLTALRLAKNNRQHERRFPVNIIATILQVLLGLAFLGAGTPKVMGQQQMVDSFRKWGYPQWFRPIVGSGEILCGIGVLLGIAWGWIAVLAALGLIFAMLGALFTHMRIHDETQAFIPPSVLLLIAVVVVALRWTTLSSHFS